MFYSFWTPLGNLFYNNDDVNVIVAYVIINSRLFMTVLLVV